MSDDEKGDSSKQAAMGDQADTGDQAETGDQADTGADTGDGEAQRMDLPKWNRARVKRKQPKGEEQDAFQGGVRKVGKTAIQRAPVVMLGIVALAGAIAAGIWWSQARDEDRAASTRLLATAVGIQARARVQDPERIAELNKASKLPQPVPLLSDEAERRPQVEGALTNLHNAHADGPAIEAAALVEASDLMREGKFEDAAVAYRGFLKTSAGHSLVFAAREGLALALEAAGDGDAAVAELDTLAGSKGAFYRDQALWQKGRVLEAQGKADEALAAYTQYVEEYPLEEDSLAKQEITQRLETLAPDLLPAKPALGPGLAP